jgi:hypothetical protein
MPHRSVLSNRFKGKAGVERRRHPRMTSQVCGMALLWKLLTAYSALAGAPSGTGSRARRPGHLQARFYQSMLLGLTIVLITSCASPPLATRQAARELSTSTPSLTAQPTDTSAPSSTVTAESTVPSSPTTMREPTKPSSPTSTLTATPPTREEEPEATATSQEATPTTPPPTKTRTPRPRPPQMASPEYGMQAFLWWRPEVATRDLGLIEDAGFGWAKQDFPWKEIEGAGKGHFDWSRTDLIVQYTEDAGLDLLVRLDRPPAWTGAQGDGPPPNLADLGDFVAEVASRYRGRIRAYQIWNEPNLAREWGGQTPSAQGYVALLKTAYQSIKNVDPQAIVISAGLSPTGSQPPEAIPDDVYLEQLYQAGVSNYLDVVGLNAPGFRAPPEMSPDEVMANQEVYGHGRWFCFRHVEDLRAIMVKHGDAGRQVAILEFGWTTDPRPDSPYNWHAVDEATQAEYLVRAYKYAREHWSPWIGLMCLIYISDPDWTPGHEQYWWSVTWPGYPEPVKRPAYEALVAMPK